MNLEAIADLERALGQLDVVFIESGGDNLAAAFSPDLADASIYVIDVSGGEVPGHSSLQTEDGLDAVVDWALEQYQAASPRTL